MPGLVFAQSDRESEQLILEEVLVTAQKREQSLLDVPMAVTAVGNQEIKDRAAFNIKDLQYAIPSLYITNNGPGQDRIQMRGVSPGLQGLPAVGVYVDEVGISLDQVQRNLEIPLVDMERIEVLRGPQGTLYGQGSMGGTIKYVTRNPDMSGSGFEGEAGFMSLDNGDTGYHGYAIANLPNSSGTFGARLVAGYDDIPGWIDDAITGEKDINSNKQAWFRGKALWQPSDTFKASLMWQHYDLESKNTNNSNPDNPDEVTQFRSSPTDDKFDLFNLILDFDFGSANLISSSGYLDRTLVFDRDLTAFFGFLVPPGGTIGIGFDTDFTVFSQEIRLSSTGEGPFNWTIGGWYRDADSWSIRSTPATPNPVMGILDAMSTAPVDAKSWAVFGDVSYAFADAWEASVGIRYYDDERNQHGSSVTFGAPSSFDDTATFDSVDPRFNLLWRYNDSSSAYINVAKGFRSGGFNTLGPPDTYDPETLWNYEIGTRTSLMDNRLTIDTALFWLDYSDVQVQDIAPGSVFANTINSGAASGLGFEFAASALLTDKLTFDFTYSRNDVTFDEDNLDKDKGDPLDYVPKYTLSGALTYRFNWTAALPGMFRVDYQKAAGYELNIGTQNVHIKTEPTAYLNARLGVEGDRWQAYLEGKNLTNEDAVLFPPGGVATTATRPMPRSYGVIVRFQY
jgi:outer membrane receptor protein involved in Fe transport